MPAQLFNALLTANFAPGAPLLISSKEVVLAFQLNIPFGGVRVEWYPEYTDGTDPVTGQALPMASWVWTRETSEEDLGNGVVRMNEVIRYFSPNAADAVLPIGVYGENVQLRRAGAIMRLRMRGNGATAVVSSLYGKIATV